MGMCWVAEVKVVGVGHERGRCVPDPLLTRDRDWKDWDDYDCYSESEHCHSDLTSDLSSHTSEASEDRQDRLFEHEFGRQWAAGTAKLVLYLLSVYEFCGAYCGSTVIHDKTARFVIVCEEPLTIAVECAQVVLDRIGTGVLPMPGFIGNRDNALHMPTSLALREDETFNSAGMDRLLAFVHAARCAVAPMTDAELVSTARLPPPELDGLGFVGDIRLQAREFDFATVNINMAKDGESLNEVPPLEESKEADFNCDNSRAGDTKDVDDVVEPSANPCRHKRPASQQSNNQNSSKRPHTTKSTRQGGDQADVAADARNVASEKGASFHIELAGSIETGVALAPVQTPVVPTHQDSPAPDAGIAAPTEPRSSNHHTEKQTSISAWAACVSEANLHSDAVPPSSGVDDDISGHATDSGRNNNIISQGRSETDSDYESGDDDRENEERVHLHIHDLLRVIQDRHVLCAPVSVDQMDQIVLYGL